jgi:hypothetical protein
MSIRDPMDGSTRDEVARSARDAVRTTAPGDRPRFAAALALRLAELGRAKPVTVQVAGTAEAFEAVRSFLADLAKGRLAGRESGLEPRSTGSSRDS